MKGPISLHPHQHLLSVFLIIVILVAMKLYLSALLIGVLSWLMVLSIFSCVYWRNVYSNPWSHHGIRLYRSNNTWHPYVFHYFLRNVSKCGLCCVRFLNPKGDIFAHLKFRDRWDLFICVDWFCSSLSFQRVYHSLRVLSPNSLTLQHPDSYHFKAQAFILLPRW